MDSDEALNFAVQYGTHMVTEILIGGQLILLREVEDGEDGGSFAKMFAMHFTSGGKWSHVDVRGGNPSLLNVNFQNKTDDDVLEAIHKWADSVQEPRYHVIVDEGITPLHQVLPWELAHERSWLKKTIEKSTASLR